MALRACASAKVNKPLRCPGDAVDELGVDLFTVAYCVSFTHSGHLDCAMVK